jgi:hypothetical protein
MLIRLSGVTEHEEALGLRGDVQGSLLATGNERDLVANASRESLAFVVAKKMWMRSQGRRACKACRKRLRHMSCSTRQAREEELHAYITVWVDTSTRSALLGNIVARAQAPALDELSFYS